MMTQPRNLVTGKQSDLFPGRYEGEEVLIFVRRHWVAFLGWILLILVMLSIPVVVLSTLTIVEGLRFYQGSRLIYSALAVCSYLLVTNAVFLTAWIEHYLEVAIITPERLIHISQIGLFNRSIAELSLLRIQDVSARTNGYFQTLFQYGQVEVESAGDAPNFIMPFTPKPHIIANTILTLHDRLVAKEGTMAASERGGGVTEESRPHPSVASAAAAVHMPSVLPPADYHHDHFSEDLISQQRELAERLAREQTQARSKVGGVDAQTSPNRLPPIHPKEVGKEVELAEGENVTFLD
ncbi:PH domain-containing protein [Candidatus Berkelbacteria bacterium]|nr:PH domain-containing protein [Candidatus Berkelbacteria bacterium]